MNNLTYKRILKILSLAVLLFFHFSNAQSLFRNGLFTDKFNSYQKLRSFKTIDNQWIVIGTHFSAPGIALIYKFNQSGLLTDTIGINLDLINFNGFTWQNAIETNDKGLLLIAIKKNYHEFAFIKLDTLFSVQWAKKYFISSSNTSASITIQLKDNSYLFSCEMKRENASPLLAMGICKIDSIGNIIWEKSIGDTLTSTLSHSFTPRVNFATDDYGFIVSGIYENSDYSMFVLKFDSSGFLQWENFYSDTIVAANHLTTPGSISRCQTGGYYITGHKTWQWLPNSIRLSPFSIKVNTTGNIEWAKYFDNSSGLYLPNMNEMSDGNLLLTYGDSLGTIMKIDNMGDTIWTRHYRGFNDGITYELDDSLIFMSSFYYFDYQQIISLLKLDNTGYYPCNETWRTNIVQSITTFNITNLYLIEEFDSTAIESVPILSSTDSMNLYYVDYCFYTNVDNIDSKFDFEIFPNPSDGFFTIKFPNFINKGKVEIRNLLGKIVFEKIIYSSPKEKFNLNNISNGVYFVQVFDEEKSYSKKLIIKKN